MRVHATLLTLVLAFATRAPWFRPLLLANAVVGFVYMVVERDALATVGTVLGPWRIPLAPLENLVANVVLHVVLTRAALRRLRPGPADATALLFEGVCLLLLDVPVLYPTAAPTSLARYVLAHVVTVVALTSREAQR